MFSMSDMQRGQVMGVYGGAGRPLLADLCRSRGAAADPSQPIRAFLFLIRLVFLEVHLG
jgi:hypothetical protein